MVLKVRLGRKGSCGLSVIIAIVCYMKKFLVFLAFSALMLTGLPLAAADYVPTTTWPYVYEDFVPGRIKTHTGTNIEYDKLNINLISGRAHFVEKGVIMQADLNTIALLTIGDDSYVCVGGKMAKVLKNTVHGAVLLRTEIDADAMNSANIGYGKSSVASTNNLSATALGAGMDFSINRSLDDLVRERSEGDPLELREVRGIYFKGSFIPATRMDVLDISGIDKDAVKQYIKNEKIKFNRVDDLAALVDFLYTL